MYVSILHYPLLSQSQNNPINPLKLSLSLNGVESIAEATMMSNKNSKLVSAITLGIIKRVSNVQLKNIQSLEKM
jgi:hypothetical protein